ncbi:hypothetical protein [Microbacterium sp. PMB16]|uniref:hypothetical protein n=1 Tax=Microbacterium sp. PMB16 TaxID=3120157 RepID=UPI003F4BAAAE
MSTLPPDAALAAAVSRRISPDRPVSLGASDSESLPWEGVESDIEVNVLALWSEPAKPSMLVVTLDLLYPGTELRAAVESAAAPLTPDRIIVAASHTHRAPMTDDTKPLLGRPDADYMAWLVGEVTTAVEEALKTVPTPVSLAAGEAVARHSINRRLRKKLVIARRPRINHVVNAPNPEGPTDERLTVLVARDTSDRPIAVVWNYACHPVGGPVRNAVSGHFPGRVRQELRADTEFDGLPVLYLQGFSGDVRPNASAEVHSIRRRLRQLLTGRLFEDMTWPSYRRWCSSLAETVISTVRAAAPIPTTPVEAARTTAPAGRFVEGPAIADVTFGRIALGGSLAVYGVSAEVVVEYAARLRSRESAPFVMCVGCTDQVIGYIPTQGVLDEGGYEAGDYCRSFGLERVAPTVDDTMMSSFATVGLPDSPAPVGGTPRTDDRGALS